MGGFFDGLEFLGFLVLGFLVWDLQKESLGEYGSGWGWDSSMPRVFDYAYGNTPVRYSNTIATDKPSINGTWVNYGNKSTSTTGDKLCDIEYTDGTILASGSQLMGGTSCRAHAYNAGNYYNFLATSAGTPEPATSSICPKGWYLPDKIKETDYSHFLVVYGVDYNATTRTNQDAGLLNLPLSFLRFGFYNDYGTLVRQGSNGNYRMTSQRLSFLSNSLDPTNDTVASNGYSVRCVSR